MALDYVLTFRAINEPEVAVYSGAKWNLRQSMSEIEMTSAEAPAFPNDAVNCGMLRRFR